jgi:hypothetical protein
VHGDSDVSLVTGVVSGELAVGEAAGGGMRGGEVAAVGREVGAHQRGQPVVVAGVHHRVAEDHHARHQRLTRAPPHRRRCRREQQHRHHRRRGHGAHLHRRRSQSCSGRMLVVR